MDGHTTNTTIMMGVTGQLPNILQFAETKETFAPSGLQSDSYFKDGDMY